MPSQALKQKLTEFQEKKKSSLFEAVTGDSAASESDFTKLRLKIKRHFNEDSSRFFQDLQTYNLDVNNRIQWADILYYLDFVGVALSDKEKKVLASQFKVVNSSYISTEYVTSMLFHGKANLQTVSSLDKSVTQQLFFKLLKDMMNAQRKSSLHLFQ